MTNRESNYKSGAELIASLRQLCDDVGRVHLDHWRYLTRLAAAQHEDALRENDRLQAVLKEIQSLALKTENANLIWQCATRGLEQKVREG